ncbi:hypothetical protein C8R46DRAFT_1219390 [Mycena filopes]|nr:hypothetical protein C8R46DRAFT_1219390 [Mycena filopes]
MPLQVFHRRVSPDSAEIVTLQVAGFQWPFGSVALVQFDGCLGLGRDSTQLHSSVSSFNSELGPHSTFTIPATAGYKTLTLKAAKANPLDGYSISLMLIALSFLALISGAASSYMADNNVGLVIWAGRNVTNQPGYIVEENRLCYNKTRGFYLSTDPKPRSFNETATRTQLIYIDSDRSSDIQNRDVYTFSAFDAQNVEQTMGVDKPTIPVDAIPYGFVRGPNNTAHDGNNTVYQFTIATNKCEQQASGSASPAPAPGPLAECVCKCAFVPHPKGDEDPSFDWLFNIQGAREADEDMTAEQDVSVEDEDAGEIAANDEADAGGAVSEKCDFPYQDLTEPDRDINTYSA